MKPSRIFSPTLRIRGRIPFISTILILIAVWILQAGSGVLGQTSVYIAPDDHTDYLWTADEETYRSAFLEMIDYYLDAVDATRENPSHLQSRWNCDGSFWMWTYEQNRTPAQFQRFINRVKDGHFSVPLTPLVSCYGGVPAEAVIRGLYYSGRVERRYKLRFPLAVAMENQTLPFGLGAVWAGCGARYSWRGICGCATRLPTAGNRENEIYWWMGPDNSQILMKWNSLYGRYGNQNYGNKGMGGYAEARHPEDVIDFVATDERFRERYPFPIIGAFGQGWDDLKTTDQSFVEAARNKSTPSLRVYVSNEEDFFKEFEENFGDRLPRIAASFGNEWDLLCASMAEVSARVKRAVEKLRTAESLATLVSLHDPFFLEGRSQDRDLAFMNLGLYWEHDWTADGPVPREERAAWQRRLADQISAYVDRLNADALDAMGDLISRTGGRPRFFVFNPLSWVRTDSADLLFESDTPIHVTELGTEKEIPFQVVEIEGRKHLRILAQNIPAVGYKVFEIRSGPGASFSQAARIKGRQIENDFYRLTVNESGAITSLVEKLRGNCEIVRLLEGSAINELVGEKPLTQGEGLFSIEEAGPVSVVLKIEASEPLPHTTRIMLLRDSPRVAIQNDITQNFDEVLTWDFSFNLTDPILHHEECGAVLLARLTSDGGHYSPRNARYDWLTLNHFADMGGREGGVILSNADCYFMRFGSSTPEHLDTSSPQLSVLAGGQVDGPKLGIPMQGKDTFFRQRFALTTRDVYDPAASMRFALEHQNPLVAAPVTRNPAAPNTAYPAATYSFLKISDPNVLLWALKPAEEGPQDGMITRVWNLADRSVTYQLAVGSGLTKAWQVTHIETNKKKANLLDRELVAHAAPQQLMTHRLFITGDQD